MIDFRSYTFVRGFLGRRKGRALSDLSHFSICLSIASRLDQVRLLRAALSGVLTHLKVPESDIFCLELAVTELANNTFEHGYKGAEDKHIEVRMQMSSQEVQIDLIDFAAPLPEEQRNRLLEAPLSLEDPNEEWPARGHGLQLVQHVVNSVEINSRLGQNHITLRKNVSLQDAK